ncbi:MAG: hypothetical protein HY903_19765 [Deltaproteobacteria bacterium]|nr:hypothetical protein [Deltaproteobacteria bacterium]
MMTHSPGRSEDTCSHRILLGLAMLSGLTLGCAKDPLHGPCTGAVDADGDGHYTPDSCRTEDAACPCDDCDDADPTVNAGATELCDAKDNTCDGLVDEGFPRLGKLCAAGEGMCGRNRCSPDGSAVVCQAADATPSVEVCDDDDNDCDGEIDEGFGTGVPCEAGVGLCRRSGTTVCNATADGAVCGAVAGASSVELCDNLDNDCDTVIDDDVAADCVDCNGVVNGRKTCAAGVWSSCPVLPEVCGDGVDNDCSGAADEGCPPPEIVKLGSLESEDMFSSCCSMLDCVCRVPTGNTCGGTTYSGYTSGILQVNEALLPALGSLLRTDAARYGVYRLGGAFTAFGSSAFGAGGTCGAARFATPAPGTLTYSGYAASVTTLEILFDDRDPLACATQAEEPVFCFGNPQADVFWLCWDAEGRGELCPSSGGLWDDVVLLTCGPDVTREARAPSSRSLVVIEGNSTFVGTIDFGDGHVVTYGASPSVPAVPARTEVYDAASLGDLAQTRVNVHTYASPGTYTLVATSSGGWVTTVALKIADGVCPALYTP